MTQEKWRLITEYQGHIFDGRYEVSNWGNVRNVETQKAVSFYSDGRGQGYLRFKLYDTNHKRIAIKVHRLVAYAFLPNAPKENEGDIDHIDGNAKNNSFSNLRWCTHADNCKAAAEARKRA